MIVAGALLAVGAATLSAAATPASGAGGLRHGAHPRHGAHHSARPMRFAGAARRRCLVKQTRPDGTVVFIDRCALESAAGRSMIPQAPAKSQPQTHGFGRPF